MRQCGDQLHRQGFACLSDIYRLDVDVFVANRTAFAMPLSRARSGVYTREILDSNLGSPGDDRVDDEHEQQHFLIISSLH